jgi:hypothetical protein
MNKSTTNLGWEPELQSDRTWAAPKRGRAPVSTPRLPSRENRTPLNERDRTLSPLVKPWVATLPVDAKPDFLCLYYPRIVNRIAICWPDVALTIDLFDQFFTDRRGTRRGFPPKALCELSALRKFALRRLHRMKD